MHLLFNVEFNLMDNDSGVIACVSHYVFGWNQLIM